MAGPSSTSVQAHNGGVHVEHLRLGNGLSALLAPMPGAPTASVWVWYRVGSKNEWPGMTGASHWVEHMLFNGSPKYPKGAMDRAIMGVGGYLNAFTDVDFTAYLSTVPASYVTLPLDIEADRMSRATMNQSEVHRERKVVLSEREGAENWPEFRAEEELWALAYRRHPYRWDPLGYPEDIRALDAPRLAEYYRRFYGPRNALVVVSGGFDRVTIARFIRSRFSRVPATGEDPTVREVEPVQTGARQTDMTGPGTTPFLATGWAAPSVTEPTAAHAMLLDVLLGGETRLFSTSSWGSRGDHPSSRLYRRLVATGLAVRASSAFGPRVHPGLFTIHAQCAAGVPLGKLEAALDRELERFAHDGPTRLELDEVREKIEQSTRLAYEGATRAAFRLGYFHTLAGAGLEERLLRQVRRIRPEAVREAARAIFHPARRVTVRYTPQGS
ncbi:MAG: insulinase family protein [Thermoplasmata archaeon]|nr:insulinase family protein [Thermoplasmata archaeon]